MLSQFFAYCRDTRVGSYNISYRVKLLQLLQSWALNTFLYLNTKYMLKMYLNTKYFLQMYLNTKYFLQMYLNTKYFLQMYLNTKYFLKMYLNTKYFLQMHLNTKYFLQMYLNTKYIDVFKYFCKYFFLDYFQNIDLIHSIHYKFENERNIRHKISSIIQ